LLTVLANRFPCALRAIRWARSRSRRLTVSLAQCRRSALIVISSIQPRPQVPWTRAVAVPPELSQFKFSPSAIAQSRRSCSRANARLWVSRRQPQRLGAETFLASFYGRPLSLELWATGCANATVVGRPSSLGPRCAACPRAGGRVSSHPGRAASIRIA
jgi:hypothetical protein